MFKLMPIIAMLDVNTNLDLTATMNNIVDWLIDAASVVGGIIAVWGGIQLILSIRDQNPDSQQRAIWTLVSGIALVALGSVLKAFGILS